MDIISKKDSEERRLKRYFTGKPCKHGHITVRRTLNGACLGCERSRDKEKKVEYRRKNKEKIAKYRADNKVTIAEANRLYKKKANIKMADDSMERYWLKKSLTPPRPYQDRDALSLLYKLAKGLTESTGVKMQVDHIWPISKGGVHHPCNMQVLEAGANRVKKDSHDGEVGVSYDDFILSVSAYA